MRVRWVSLTVALWMGIWSLPAHAADVPVSEEARAHFNAGVNLLQDPDGARYEEAYREFRAAYQASASWKILGNLGIVAMKLERDGEAIDAFARYLEEGGEKLDPEDRAQTERDLQTLRTGVVRISLEANRPGARLTDERALPSGTSVVNRYGPMNANMELGVRSGHHRLTASLAGFKDIVIEVDAEPQQKLRYRLDFQPEGASSEPRHAAPVSGAADAPRPSEADKRPLLRALSYAAFGVGLVGVGAGTLFAVGAKSKFDEANELCPQFPCSLSRAEAERREELGDAGQSRKTLSVAGFIVGGAGLAAGATLLVLGTRRNENASRPPEVWVSMSSLGVRGQF